MAAHDFSYGDHTNNPKNYHRITSAKGSCFNTCYLAVSTNLKLNMSRTDRFFLLSKDFQCLDN